MHQLKIFFEYVKVSVASSISLRESFLLQSFFMLLSNIIYFSFWMIYFNNFSAVKGWTLSDVACLYGIVSCAYGLFSVFLGGSRYLARMIFEGDLDSMLVKPKNLLIQIMGSRSVPSGWGDIASSIVFIVASDYLTLWNLPLIVLFIATACIIITSFSIILGSLAFWIGDSHMLSKQLFEFLLTFSNYPKSIYEGGVKLFLLTVVPSGFIGFVPIEVIKEFSIYKTVYIVAFSLVYFYIAVKIFYFGLSSYSSGNKVGFKV